VLAVTDRFLTALRESHAISVAATVFAPSAPTTPRPVQIIGGSVTIDRDARLRRQASLEIAFSLEDPETVPLVRELPFGGFAVIERGIAYADGTVERVQLGRFRVESIVWQELQGRATLTLADPMAQVADEPFLAPYSPAGLKPSDAAVSIVYAVFGDSIAYHVTTSPASETAIADTVYTDDRAAALSDLAASVNAEALFDNFGDFVLRPRSRPTSIAWAVDVGEHGSMLAASETLDRSSVRNGVAVAGQLAADLPPIYALATYDDPTAPTRWAGPFGKVALLVSSTAVQTQEQADETAASLLNLRLGLQRTLTVSSLPNPALEPDDLLEFTFADGRVEQQYVNAARIGLDVGGTLELTTTSDLASPVFVFSGHDALVELGDARLVPA